MRQAFSGFGLITGTTYPFRALGVFFRNPNLWQYLVIPILINVLVGIFLYVSLVFVGFELVEDLVVNLSHQLDNLIANLPQWLSFLEYLIIGLGWLIRLLLIIAILLFTGFILMQFGVLLGAPWYGQLSEKLEKLRTGNLQIVEVGFVRDIWRAILFELKKILLVLIVSMPLFLVNFLFPGIGSLFATIGGICLTSTIVCLDFLDSPLERRRLRFRDKLGIVWKSLPASASFSLVCLGLISIPFLNLFTIPLCVASGTLFFCDRILPRQELQPQNNS